jgi:hypothetical protein
MASLNMAGTKRMILIFFLMSIMGILEMLDYTHETPVTRIDARGLAAPTLHDGWTCPYPRKRISCAQREAVKRAYEGKRIVACLWDDNSGSHREQLSQFNKPTNMAWDRDCDPTKPGNLFALSSMTHESYVRGCCGNDTYHVFIATEPPAIQNYIYAFLNLVYYEYDAILSIGGPEVLKVPNVIYWSWGSSWVPLDQWQMYPKTKLCSIIASDRRITTGHNLRHEIVEMFKAKGFDCDILGRGYKTVTYKRDGLADYMFSIIIENSVTGKYMTEKIMDALACGTVPVYWGTHYAREVFGDALLPWDTKAELQKILPMLTPAKYQAMVPAVKIAQDKAREFVPPERWLWENVFKCAYEWHATHDECTP